MKSLTRFGAAIVALLLLAAPTIALVPRANPSVRDSTIATGTGTAISIAEPSGVTTGDVVVVILNANSLPTLADNNGGTPFSEEVYDDVNVTSGMATAIYTRRWQSGDPSTYAFTIENSQRWGAVAIAVENVHPSTMFDAALVSGEHVDVGGGGASDCDANSITTVTDNALHLAIMTLDSNAPTIGGTPSGYTVLESGADQHITAAAKIITSAGATGAQNFNTFSPTGLACSGYSLALRSEDAGGATFPPAIINSIIVN